MDRPVITTDNTVTLLETKFLNIFDLQYQEGKHYYAATRHKKEDLAALGNDNVWGVRTICLRKTERRSDPG